MRGEAISCSPGQRRDCSVKVAQDSGVLSCFRGTQFCGDNGFWQECSDGDLSLEISPQSLRSDRDVQALSTPQACVDNPCDPGCQFYDEGGGFSPSAPAPPPDCVSGKFICAYAILGQEEATVRSDGVLQGDVAGGDDGIALNDGALAEQLVSTGPIDTGTNAMLEGIYSSYSGAGPAITVNEYTEVNGDIHAPGDVHITGHVTVNGTIRAGGNIFFTSGNTQIAGEVRAGGSVEFLGDGVKLLGDLHAGSDVSLAGDDKTLTGDVYAGGNVSIEGASSNRIEGDVHAGGHVSLLDGNKHITGEVHLGGSATVCGSCTTGAVRGPASVIAPFEPEVVPAPEIPDLSLLKRDVSEACALALSAPDHTSGDIVVTPGVYGRVTPGYRKQLRLQGGGSYVFESIELTWRDRMVFEGTGPWDITVCQNHSTRVGDPRDSSMMDTPAFYASLGPGGRFELADGSLPAPHDITIYSPETNGACIALGHIEYSGLLIAPECEILGMFDSSGEANLWGQKVWTADSVPLSTLSQDECEKGSFFGDLDPLLGGTACPLAEADVGLWTMTEAYEADCPSDTSPLWSLLSWHGVTPGNSHIELSLRASEDGVFTDAWTVAPDISRASGNEDCNPLSSCYLDITAALWPGGIDSTPRYLEVQIGLASEAGHLPVLGDFKVYYSCVMDQ